MSISYQDPARYFMEQQSRKDEQFRSLLNMFMMMKQQKYGREQDTWERQQKEKELAMMEPYYQTQAEANKAQAEASRALAEQRRVPPIPWEEELRRAGIGDIQAERIKAEFRQPPRPTDFDKRKTRLDKLLADNKISPDQHREALLGVDMPKSPEEVRKQGYTARDSNRRSYSQAVSKLPESYGKNKAKYLRNMIKDTPNTRPVIGGFPVDMPVNYIVSSMNQKDGVATPEDKQTVAKYDVMFRYFMERVLPQDISYKEWLTLPKAKDPLMDRAQMKLWFDIYKDLWK